MTPRMQGISGVVAAQAMLGTLGLCVLEAGADPLSTAFYRCAISALALGLYAAFRGDLGRILQLPSKLLLLALISGILMVGNWVLFFEAIRRSGITMATIVFHVQPFVMVLLGAAVFGERLHALTFVWIGVALVGLALATGSIGAVGTSAMDWRGPLCALAAAALYAGVTIIAKGFPRSSGLQLTLVQCFCGVIVLLAWLPLPPQSVALSQWPWFALIGIVHTGGVYILLYNALPKLPTAVAAVLLFIYPLSAIVVDAVYAHHTLSALQALGFGAIVLASLGITLKWGCPTAV